MAVNVINVSLDFGRETSRIVNHVIAMVTHRLANQALENVYNVTTTLPDSTATVVLKDTMEIHCWAVKSDVVPADVLIPSLLVTRSLINVL